MNERINRLIKSVFDLSDSQVSQDLSKDAIPRWDSLTHMDLIISLEKEFSLQLSIDDIVRMRSLDSIRAVVAEKTR
jgi:acyl carrier protein